MEKEKVTDILGFTSTVIFTLVFIPQVYTTTKKKSAKDLSLSFLLLSILGCSLMIPYSIILKLVPVLISNIIMIILNIYLVVFKILEYYKYFK